MTHVVNDFCWAWVILMDAFELLEAMRPTPRVRSARQAVVLSVIAAAQLAGAIFEAAHQDWFWVPAAIYGALLAYNTWRGRRRRQRRPSRALGRVVDLGHRLAVRHEPEHTH